MFKKIYLLSPKAILSDTVAEIFDLASSTRCLKSSQYDKLAKASNELLDRRDREAIERLFRWVQKGRIRLINDGAIA